MSNVNYLCYNYIKNELHLLRFSNHFLIYFIVYTLLMSFFFLINYFLSKLYWMFYVDIFKTLIKLIFLY